jgi:hypothetical protein
MNACPVAMAWRTIAATTTTMKTKLPMFLGSGPVNDGSAARATTTPMVSDSQKYRLRLAIQSGMAEV